MAEEITAARFRAAVGREPENDDLSRSNCSERGDDGHWCCGWDHAANLPVFMTGTTIYRLEK